MDLACEEFREILSSECRTGGDDDKRFADVFERCENFFEFTERWIAANIVEVVSVGEEIRVFVDNLKPETSQDLA